jgi:hypothetical protein
VIASWLYLLEVFEGLDPHSRALSHSLDGAIAEVWDKIEERREP